MARSRRVAVLLVLMFGVGVLLPPPASAYQIRANWYSSNDGQTKRYVWDHWGDYCSPNHNFTLSIAVKISTITSTQVFVEWVEYKAVVNAAANQRYIVNINLDIQDQHKVVNVPELNTMYSGIAYRRTVNQWFTETGAGVTFWGAFDDNGAEACMYGDDLWVDLRP